MIITIDGPSGSGKSTLAKKIAQRFQFDYLDTGAHYRSVTYWIACKGEDLSTFIYDIVDEGGEKRYFVNGEDVSRVIRTSDVAKHVSAISKRADVRKVLTEWQREYAKTRDVILDGRDVGSVVFPYASCKFFLVASSRIRAERRHKELSLKKMINPKEVSVEKIEEELLERDRIDSTREIAPLIKPEGAIEIDTSLLSIQGVEREMCKALKRMRLYPYKNWKKKLFGEGFARTHSFYLFAKAITHFFLHIFYRFEFYGKENIPKGKGIVAPNHTSFFDPPVAAAAFPEELFYMAQDYLFRVPLLGFCITRLGALPTRGDVGDKNMLQEVTQILGEGRKVMIFPEGERSFDNTLFPLKRGVASLSLATDTPVVPVYIDGCFRAWKRGQYFPKPYGKFTVIIGSPIFPKQYASIEGKKESQKALLEELKKRLEVLKLWFESGKQGPIP